jgi:hypothetical protein
MALTRWEIVRFYWTFWVGVASVRQTSPENVRAPALSSMENVLIEAAGNKVALLHLYPRRLDFSIYEAAAELR